MLQHWSNGQYHETPLGDFSVNHGQGLILLRLHQVVRASVSACVCSRALSVDHTHRPLVRRTCSCFAWFCKTTAGRCMQSDT